jgi:hypothetical protein|tara:strand:- start:23 stop:703 length:681 start_codon:yes stop_codon:yes gene_type:complete
MNIDNTIEKCEESGAMFTVDHAGSELEISNASCLTQTQVGWLEENSAEVINFLWTKRQQVLKEIKKVFHDLDLPWTEDDYKSLSAAELEAELEKALPLLQDEDLLKEVEEARQARLAGSDDGSSKLWVHPNGMIYSDGSMFRNVDDPDFRAAKEKTLPPPNPYCLTETIGTPMDQLEELVPDEFKAKLAGLKVSPETMRNCLRLYLDGQKNMAVKYLCARVGEEGN